MPAPQTGDAADRAGADPSVGAPPESVAPPRAIDARRKPEGSRWYGWQTLATDGAAVALLAIGVAAEKGPVIGVSAATFALGGPIVHLAHGRGGAAAGSLGLRVGIPVAGFFVGAAMQHCNHTSEADDLCGFEGAAIGMLAGAGIAMLLDSALLAHEDARREQPQRVARLFVSPAVSMSKSSGTVGLVGTF